MNPANPTPDGAESFRTAHVESCRKGGQRSGESRRTEGRRPFVEHAIRSRVATGNYDRDTAGKIAAYLGVSSRFVRKIAMEIKAELK